MGKTAAIENGFLDTRYEAEPEILADFADFAKETEVENERLISAAAKIIQQLINDEQQTDDSGIS